MNTVGKKISRFFLLSLMGFALLRCGSGNSNSIHIVVNGQTYEMSLENSQCQAGIPSGAGLYNLPLSCSAGFSNTTGLSDALVISVTDVRAINDQLGVFIPVSPSLLIMQVTLDGTQLAVTSGGAVFTQISNTLGGQTCFEFVLDSTTTHMEGNFCANNSTGY